MMLRAGDLLSLLVEDVINHKDQIKDEIVMKQQKTKTPHILLISDETKGYLQTWIQSSKKYEDDFLFTGQNRENPLNVRWYLHLVKEWVRHLDLILNNTPLIPSEEPEPLSSTERPLILKS